MIIFLEEKDIDLDIIDNEISHINSILNNEKNLKKLLMSYMDKITIAVNNIVSPIDINSIHKCLENLKTNLDNLNNIISLYTPLLDSLQTLRDDINNIKKQNVMDYNFSYKEVFTKCSKANSEIYSFIDSLTPYINITFPEETIQEENTDEIKEDNTQKDDENLSNLKENTLIISEKNQNVVLPYTILELQKKLNDSPQDYNSIQDIVEKCYTIPLETYKSASLSRFKEAFNLIKQKEKGNIKRIYLLFFFTFPILYFLSLVLFSLF